MFRLIIRNLAHTLRRYPLPSAINLAGLVVALTAFIIIMSHVEYETTFDRSYPTSGRIFRVDRQGRHQLLGPHRGRNDAHALLGQAAVLHRRRCR